jgi:hypothetical protein
MLLIEAVNTFDMVWEPSIFLFLSKVIGLQWKG